MPKNNTDCMNEFFEKQLSKLEALNTAKRKNWSNDRALKFQEKTEGNWVKEFEAVRVLKTGLKALQSRVNTDQIDVQLDSTNFMVDVTSAITSIVNHQSDQYSFGKNNNNPNKTFIRKESKLTKFINELMKDAQDLDTQMQQPERCFVM